MAGKKDPTEAIRKKAASFTGVEKGNSCTQSSFKVAEKTFLYIGEQGGRYKAMFKLRDSMKQAAQLAKKEPESFAVGSTSWVTARFTEQSPMPKLLWERWLQESYTLSCVGSAKKKSSIPIVGLDVL